MFRSQSILIVDIDGVACEHAKAICEWVNNEYDLTVTTEDVTSWDHDFGPITFVGAVDICYAKEEFILQMEVSPGFECFLERISQVMTVKFASARALTHDATRMWIQRNFGEFETVFVKSKAELDFDFIVDDYLGEVIDAANTGKTCFLFSRPWNDNEETRNAIGDLNGIHFVRSFDEIAVLLCGNG